MKSVEDELFSQFYSKTPSIGSTIYNTNKMNNADEKKFYNNKNVKTNIYIK